MANKTIYVSEKVHKELAILKAKTNCMTLNDVINELLEKQNIER